MLRHSVEAPRQGLPNYVSVNQAPMGQGCLVLLAANMDESAGGATLEERAWRGCLASSLAKPKASTTSNIQNRKEICVPIARFAMPLARFNWSTTIARRTSQSTIYSTRHLVKIGKEKLLRPSWQSFG